MLLGKNYSCCTTYFLNVRVNNKNSHTPKTTDLFFKVRK